MVRAALALAAIVCAATAHAAPVKLKCRIVGPKEPLYGPLSVTFDAEVLRVEVTSERFPDLTWTYQNGLLAPILPRGPEDNYAASTPRPQFVRLDPRTVSFGYRDDEDPSNGVVASFNRSALGTPAAPCLWHSSRAFAAG